VNTRPVAATRLRGIWMGVTDFEQSREFYELLGAYFDATGPVDGIVSATLGGTKLFFEAGHANPAGTGPFLLFNVTDADALHAELEPRTPRLRVRPRMSRGVASSTCETRTAIRLRSLGRSDEVHLQLRDLIARAREAGHVPATSRIPDSASSVPLASVRWT
jgi:hypothetical protein